MFFFCVLFDKTLGSTGGREKAEVEGLLKEKELSLERIGIDVGKCGRYPGCDICGPLVPKRFSLKDVPSRSVQTNCSWGNQEGGCM